MPGSRDERIRRLIDGLEEAGYVPAEPYDPSEQPLLLSLRDGISLRVLRIFSWAITHGGAKRSRDEFRVQTTRRASESFLHDSYETLLLGYDDQRDVFAAWDVRVHPNPGTSSSLQVPGHLLEEARTVGVASRARHTTTGSELVVAFSPGAIGAYLDLLPDLPGPAASGAELLAAAKAGSDESVPVEELPEDVERQAAIHRIRARVRDQRFRWRVVRAYKGACTFCGIRVGLVDAAHVQGVADGGPDLVRNGVAACPTHHRALDRGLVLITDDLSVSLNESRLRGRGASRQDIEAFRRSLGTRLVLPDDDALRPAPEFIKAHRALWVGDGVTRRST